MGHGQYLRFVPELFESVRDATGPDLQLLHDAHHRLTPIEAAGLGRRLEDIGLFWLEDPVPAELQAGYRIIRQHTTTPLAVGEVFNTVYDCEQLVREQLIDFLTDERRPWRGYQPYAQGGGFRRDLTTCGWVPRCG